MLLELTSFVVLPGYTKPIILYFTACSSTDLQNNFVEYPAYNIKGNNIALEYLNNDQQCKDLCVTTAACRTTEYHAATRSCNTGSVTFLDVATADKILGTNAGWVHYQRTCA